MHQSQLHRLLNEAHSFVRLQANMVLWLSYFKDGNVKDNKIF